MQHSTSKLLTSILAGGAWTLCLFAAVLPAAAHGRDARGPAPRTAPHAAAVYRAPRAAVYRAPRAAVYRAPRAAVYRAPHAAAVYRTPRAAVYRAPRAAVYRAPRAAVYRAPHASVYRALRRVAAPGYRAVASRYRAVAAPRYRAVAPRYRAVAPRYRAVAPRYRAVAPRYRAYHARAAFAQREAGGHRAYVQRAPFVQYVREPRRRTAYVQRYRIVRSPLMRAVYAPRERREIVYHPAYLTGRVVEDRRDVVVLQPPTGSAIPVRCGCAYRYRTGSYAAVPAVYDNGSYYASPYSPQYYPQVAQWYSNYYGTPVTYSNGYYVPQNSYAAPPAWTTYGQYDNDGDENGGYYSGSSYGDGYSYGSQYGNDPYYGYANTSQPYYGSAPYGTYDSYGTPYQYGAGYGTPYAPQQVQGLVLAKAGSMLMVLGGNGLNPVLVDAGPAYQNGYAMNGPVAAGQVIDAYGYYSGNTFVATALM